RRADHPSAEGGRRWSHGEGGVPAARGVGADLLPLEGEVRRDGRQRGAAAEAAGGGEPAAEAAGGRQGVGPPGTEGGALKKMVRPAALRQAVGFVQAQFEVSARRACRIVGCPRATWNYGNRPAAGVWTRRFAVVQRAAAHGPGSSSSSCFAG